MCKTILLVFIVFIVYNTCYAKEIKNDDHIWNSVSDDGKCMFFLGYGAALLHGYGVICYGDIESKKINEEEKIYAINSCIKNLTEKNSIPHDKWNDAVQVVNGIYSDTLLSG